MPTIQRPRFNKIKKELQLHNRAEFQLHYNSEAFKQAACAGVETDFFYPPKDIFSPDEKAMITRMCMACPILEMCREWGLVHERYGVWGGLVPIDREKMRQKLKWSLIDPVSGMPRSYKG